MASSSSMIHTATVADERDRKRKRPGGEPEPGTEVTPRRAPSKWRTRREHEIYSTKLLDALRLVRVRAGGGFPCVAARSRSRWSRAILLTSRNRVRLVRAQAPAPPLPMPRRPSTDASN